MIRMHAVSRLFGVTALVVATVSCGDVVRTGRGSSYIIVDSMSGIRGAVNAGQPSATLISDVITNVVSGGPCTQLTPCPTVFGDSGLANMHIAMKDAGSLSPTNPSPVNSITLTRYRVEYSRADGRNTPGIDVPYAFDGAITATVSTGATNVGFSLVRVQAKGESPLVQLRGNIATVTMIAKVTFYGADQAGNEATATGNIQIDFGNFGDQ
jgi:hypothetical protein